MTRFRHQANTVSANLRCTDIELALEVAGMSLGPCVCHHVLIRMTPVNPLREAALPSTPPPIRPRN